ncbi:MULTISPECIES: phosphate ABC transporter substrate-binding/OmpA family protein [Thiorhodovibrio]|uniref:phosphate ABC transporter substrate-binding/OmpA family protein n=1 Tax=Thiorhodovibrio TaxID=61593 RepID=UPI001911D049|nr:MULTISPECIES: phosphate ABC transporter substrate-binding/OmpA family protein [Thiorhodovibrio]MBK5969263.1 hypothetical protein [Thiorhodovibrio winogradskyi]WPL11254.1 Alpha-agarase precursor [Thiorhodovibrio litoralis]
MSIGRFANRRSGKRKTLALVLVASLCGASVVAAALRDHVSVIGPRTVYPFFSELSDRFGRTTPFKFPRIEITDTRTAFKLLCSGEGSEFPDLALANREMSEREQAICVRNGVSELASLQLGYDAVALAAFEDGFADIAPRTLFLALAAAVPEPVTDAEQPRPAEPADAATQVVLMDNPYRVWSEVEPSLPDAPIILIVPPRASVAYDLFLDILRTGCREIPYFAALEEKNAEEFERQCTQLRDDEVIEPYLEELEKVLENKDGFDPGQLIVVDQSTLVSNAQLLRPVALNGALPTVETINDDNYPGARPVYLFIRNGQIGVIPGLREFVTELTSEAATGPDGYLRALGFVPLSDERRADVVAPLLSGIVKDARSNDAIVPMPGQARISPQARLRRIDSELWSRVRRSDNPDVVKLYVELLPDGLFRRPARLLEQRLRARDQDRDGVNDAVDHCPETAPKLAVDTHGCPPDADADGVPDELDQCADTAPGNPVDAQGCLPDRDGDGISDCMDLCGKTPADTPVDADGCALDADADGIPDSLDQCPDSAAGSPVDTHGCALDADADGVPDSLDQCPGSTADTPVDTRGCTPKIDDDGDGVDDASDNCKDTPEGITTDERGCWVLSDLKFRTNSASLAGIDTASIDQVLEVLRRTPEIQIEIQGHSDNEGVHAINLRLSDERAQAVADYLINAGIDPARLEVRGYGPDNPIAPNDTPEGRALNRRVELKVQPRQ